MPTRWSLLLFACLGATASCTVVRPWERGRLAAPAMVEPLAERRMVTQYRAKVLESRTGGGLPGTASGGGCGCSQ